MLGKLKDIALFKQIDKSIIGDLIKSQLMFEKEYSKDATVHNQGEVCTGIDFVLTGKLIAYALSSNGSETIVFEFSPGSIIGANLLFGRNNIYPMNIYCTNQARLIQINKKGIEILLHNYNFTLEYIKELSHNAQGMNKKIAMYTQKTLRENLLDYFSLMSVQQDSKEIILPITKKQLADYFGVQRPSLFRELKKMKDEGIIDINNRKIIIK